MLNEKERAMAEEPVADDAIISGKSNCDYVIEILQATNDGHDLYLLPAMRKKLGIKERK
jgi:hypothetical protein